MTRKLTYEFVKDQIENILHPGSKLISTTYMNCSTKLEITCEKGHQILIDWDHIKSGKWCAECAGTKKLTYENIKNKIENELHPGAKLLSLNYKNAFTKLNIECENNHKFKCNWNSIDRGRWCPECAGTKKLTYDYIKNEIENELHPGSNLISSKYINSKQKLKIRCEFNHLFSSPWNSIKSGQWCPECSKTKKLDYDYIKNKIEDELHPGSRLLSKDYINAHTKLEILCENSHRMFISWNSIDRGSWCNTCGINRTADKQKHHIIYIINQIENVLHPGSKLLSPEYKNARQKLIIQCEKSHVFKMTWNCIQSGQWCPECSSYKGERIVRLFFQTIFNANFSRKKPKWLKNKDGSSLELDGYNKELKIAFEHQGYQHNNPKAHYHKSLDDYKKLQEHDDIKLKECCKRGITLIRVPELFTSLKINDLKEFIKNEFIRLGKPNLLPKSYDNIEIDYYEIYRE